MGEPGPPPADGEFRVAFGPPTVAETGEPRRLLLELLLLLFML